MCRDMCPPKSLFFRFIFSFGLFFCVRKKTEVHPGALQKPVASCLGFCLFFLSSFNFVPVFDRPGPGPSAHPAPGSSFLTREEDLKDQFAQQSTKMYHLNDQFARAIRTVKVLYRYLCHLCQLLNRHDSHDSHFKF